MKKQFASLWLLCCVPFLWAQENDFNAWKMRFMEKAKSAGLHEPLLAEYQQIVKFYPSAVSSDKGQSEFKKFLWDYLASVLSSQRIAQGQKQYTANATLLSQVSERWGVPAQIIVAIWGMESSYGGYTGNVPIMSSMSTLAYEGRRRDFFEKQLISAMRLVESGDLSSLAVKGSWAGGMGMTQFIPTTYNRYAVDFDGDGGRNLWEAPDALASTANYLSAMGWQRGISWGTEVSLSSGFDYMLANDTKGWQPISEWADAGVLNVNGTTLANSNHLARLFVPAGKGGPKFLLFKNFNVIKKYNNSDAYALGVALLSDRIAGRSGLMTSWPVDAKRLRKVDIKAVQWILNQKGFNAGLIDGIWGNNTRRALQSYQSANGIVADGFLSVELFRHLIQGAIEG